MTYVGDDVHVGSGQAEVTDHLQAPVVGRQVEGGPAVLEEERNAVTAYRDEVKRRDPAAARGSDSSDAACIVIKDVFHPPVHQ